HPGRPVRVAEADGADAVDGEDRRRGVGGRDVAVRGGRRGGALVAGDGGGGGAEAQEGGARAAEGEGQRAEGGDGREEEQAVEPELAQDGEEGVAERTGG